MKVYLKLIAIGLSAMALLAMTTPTYAEFFNVKVVNVVPRAENNGDVFIQVEPAEGETRFNEKSRVIIDGTSPGASRLLTVMMSGLLLNKTVSVLVDDPPSFASPQIIGSAGVKAD